MEAIAGISTMKVWIGNKSVLRLGKVLENAKLTGKTNLGEKLALSARQRWPGERLLKKSPNDL